MFKGLKKTRRKNLFKPKQRHLKITYRDIDGITHSIEDFTNNIDNILNQITKIIREIDGSVNSNGAISTVAIDLVIMKED